MNYNVDLPLRNSISKDQWKMYEVTNQRFFLISRKTSSLLKTELFMRDRSRNRK